MSKKKYTSNIRAELAEIAKNTRKNKRKKISLQAACTHRNKKGKLALKQSKKNPDVWVCRACRAKIDFGAIAGLDVKEMKEEIKKTTKAQVNHDQMVKLMLNPKEDARIIEMVASNISTSQFLKPIKKVSLAENFNPKNGKGKNKNNNKKNKNKGGSFTTGGRSLGGFR